MRRRRRVVLNARFRRRRNPSGVDYYADHLATALGLEEAVPPAWLARPVLGDLWEQLVLPFKVRGAILVSPCNSGPVLKHRQLLIIHDVAPDVGPQWFSAPYRLKSWFMLSVAARRAKAIGTVSASSAAAIRTRINRSAFVIPNVPQRREPTSPPSDSVLPLLHRSFLLSVANLEPRKNLDTVLAAWRQVRTGFPEALLVVAGASGSSAFGAVDLHDGASGVEGAVFLGRVDDCDLAHLYDCCAAVVTVPFHEGFGRVLLEGLLHGAHVIASDIEAHRELAVDVEWVVPLDREALQRAMSQALSKVRRTRDQNLSGLTTLLDQQLVDQFNSALDMID